MTLLFSYNDVDVYERDAKLFEEGNWINDTCINFEYKLFESKFNKKDILLMDPSVVSFLRIQVGSPDELQDLRNGLNIEEKDWIFMPISDSDSFSINSTHWSLIFCNKETGLMFHFDSNGNYNYNSAMKSAERLYHLIDWYSYILRNDSIYSFIYY